MSVPVSVKRSAKADSTAEFGHSVFDKWSAAVKTYCMLNVACQEGS